MRFYFYPLLFLFTILCSSQAQAQSTYSNKWFMGWTNTIMPYTGSGLRFSSTTADTFGWALPISCIRTNSQIVKDDSMLIYTNGDLVYNGQGNVLDKGDQLKMYPGNDNIALYRGALLIPFANSPFKFHLFHEDFQSFPINYPHITAHTDNQPLELLYSIADLSLKSGQGAMTRLNQVLITDTLNVGNIAACKHANGRDWWVLLHTNFTNRYYRILIENDSVHPAEYQDIGDTMTAFSDYGQCTFTQDGSKFTFAMQKGGKDTMIPTLELFDFDRCTGMLSNFKSASFSYTTGLVSYVGMEFSPNQRFIYISTNDYLFQYDSFDDSIRHIYTKPFVGMSLGSMQIAPNGKIYVHTWDGTKFLHYINQPDSLGLACDFRPQGLDLPNDVDCLPYIPNYNLGALKGSGCDTLLLGVSNQQPDTKLSIFPNPVSNELSILRNSSHTSADLYIYDALGIEVYHKVSTLEREAIDVSRYASGIYLLRLSTTSSDCHIRFVVAR